MHPFYLPSEGWESWKSCDVSLILLPKVNPVSEVPVFLLFSGFSHTLSWLFSFLVLCPYSSISISSTSKKKKLQSKQFLLALEFLPLTLLQRESKVTQRQKKKENDGRILNNGITISNKYFKKLLWSLCGKGINGDEIKVEAETLESCCNTWIKDDSDLEVCKDRGYKWNQETQNIFWR